MITDQITHTARRDHICAICGRTVHTGEQYVRAQVPGGGRVKRQPMHTACYTRRADGVSKLNIARQEKHDGTN